MTSHILLPQLDPNQPATFSPIVLNDLLLEELGFSGVVVSDALDMVGASGSLGIAGAAVAALRGGCDLLCLGTGNTDAQLTEIERAVSNAVAEGSLSASRVQDAAGGVRRLAEELEVARQGSKQPGTFTPGWDNGMAELVDSLDIQAGADAWRTRAAGQYTVVRLEADANIAVGGTRWGPFAAAGFAAQPVYAITPGRSDLPPLQPEESVLVVGRDIHRHQFAREAIDRLRSSHANVLVVDMGWPSADRRYADVATFGASRLMGQVLLEWLER